MSMAASAGASGAASAGSSAWIPGHQKGNMCFSKEMKFKIPFVFSLIQVYVSEYHIVF